MATYSTIGNTARNVADFHRLMQGRNRSDSITQCKGQLLCSLGVKPALDVPMFPSKFATISCNIGLIAHETAMPGPSAHDDRIEFWEWQAAQTRFGIGPVFVKQVLPTEPVYNIPNALI
jgi:hypothetical protein